MIKTSILLTLLASTLIPFASALPTSNTDIPVKVRVGNSCLGRKDGAVTNIVKRDCSMNDALSFYELEQGKLYLGKDKLAMGNNLCLINQSKLFGDSYVGLVKCGAPNDPVNTQNSKYKFVITDDKTKTVDFEYDGKKMFWYWDGDFLRASDDINDKKEQITLEYPK
ncbi:hypothetical protein ROZALSC1DRAFT_31575 [Rozella allomycis CSF55]|uniref:Cyanovirin-N domain-containing protein n=1 Tax=Rozella allomycis (strain CSF55) TaxID=988480 RepID=A0A075B2P6_ROZAC|nr:hypothetical protein O9G_005820 [Rozella allomycis CSF55]RKP16504.1 hypothetical protein ROZALSC1DRAFT_31575 [Rozella allomycis CSF55]|eukprot:EPZ36875.1 hypothetical protein O9G_005820 [Rozella allomycis CSF55]